MVDALARLLIGPAADLADGFDPEIPELRSPGRANRRIERAAGNRLVFKAQSPRVEPFFNPIGGHSGPKIAA